MVLSIGVLSNASTVYITSENNITCAVSANPITLHTPNGSSVTAYVYTEGWTSVGKNSIKNYWRTRIFPWQPTQTRMTA